MIGGFIGFVFLLAYTLALLEIQIEGRDGWAAKAPCWRNNNKWIVRLNGGRPLTGYHFYLNIFMFLMIHFPFVLFWDWQLEKELLVWGALFLFWVVEDFSWFVFNPWYGLRNFKKAKISWHPNWWGPVPRDYYLGLVLSGLLLWFGRGGI
ncbi:MAG: hypothetical protein A2175_01200 [Candidatus Nealsonbacteria bacterium RBG_13_42_11]|uniref:Uncharacterized protein n=1 Tax=Candidatus Nealsonbacteria bacterium RBG_13_42_11 TaxID=1801663 RepID=A0A1G2DYD4_9BACT|nr:MAG: hypothetical protein A2175_01200 [Candidatus Nealsonbacteria bacterium RBG_13_42_11]